MNYSESSLTTVIAAVILNVMFRFCEGVLFLSSQFHFLPLPLTCASNIVSVSLLTISGLFAEQFMKPHFSGNNNLLALSFVYFHRLYLQ